MSRYPLGQAIIIGDPAAGYITVRDALTGALVTPATATTTIQRPDGALGTPYTAFTTVSTGTIYQAVPASDLLQYGEHRWRLVTTAPGGVWTGSFEVYDPFEPTLIDVQEAKEQLEKTGSVDDAELLLFVAAVTKLIESEVGPCSLRTIVEVVPGGRVLRLNTLPVVSITSIAGIYLGTPTYVTAGLSVDPITGIIRQPTFFPWVGPLTVTYIAGRTVIPPDVQLAARLLLQHLWATKRAQSAAPMAGGFNDVQPTPGAGYLWPNRVRELLSNEQLPPAVA